jgi:hypothetical protein
LSARLPRPKAVRVVSAHWVTTGSRVMASAHPETIHDFYGFPRPLYAVQYPAPGAPQQANQLAQNPEIVPDEKWGLDHGAWSVLRHMYPRADVPTFQLSLDERRSITCPCSTVPGLPTSAMPCLIPTRGLNSAASRSGRYFSAKRRRPGASDQLPTVRRTCYIRACVAFRRIH